MKTHIEKVDLTVTTTKNSLPTSRPAVGWFKFSNDFARARFDEDENASVIYGKAKSRRVFYGPNCSVWWNPEKERFTIRISVKPNPGSLLMSQCSFEECQVFIANKIK